MKGIDGNGVSFKVEGNRVTCWQGIILTGLPVVPYSSVKMALFVSLLFVESKHPSLGLCRAASA